MVPSEAVVLAHLTDPHVFLGRPTLAEALGKRGLSYFNWIRKRRHLHRPEVVGRIVADLRAAAPDFIAMTGDLVNFGLEREFAGSAGWLTELGPPERVGAIPGNHEAMVAGFEGPMRRHWGAYCAGEGGAEGFPWLRRVGPVSVIGLSSAVATPPGMAGGRIGTDQLAALGPMLAAARAEGQCRVVLVHHPPTEVTDWRRSLWNRAELRQVIATEGAELVLHGHTHRADFSWIDTPAGRVPVLGAPSASMAHGTRYDPAAWRRLAFTRDGTGWRLTLQERRIGRSGAVEDGPHLAFRLPPAEVAPAAARA
jgi:3',5'-cyclic AMP phosphodiesterase CpdA